MLEGSGQQGKPGIQPEAHLGCLQTVPIQIGQHQALPPLSCREKELLKRQVFIVEARLAQCERWKEVAAPRKDLETVFVFVCLLACLLWLLLDQKGWLESKELNKEKEMRFQRTDWNNLHPTTPNQKGHFQEALEKCPLKRSDEESTVSFTGVSHFKHCDHYTRQSCNYGWIWEGRSGMVSKECF